MRYGLTWHFDITTSAADPDLMEHVDGVMQQLLDLEGGEYNIRDSGIGLDADRGHVEIELSLETDDMDKAVGISKSVVRTAVHAAGGYTDNWDMPVRDVEYEFVDVVLASRAPLAAGV